MGPSTLDARLSVIIVSYRSEDALAATLPALERELRDGDEIVVVDNASTHDSVDAVRRLAPGATVVANAHNAGFPAGCNLGAAESRNPLLVFLNPDAVPQPGWGAAIRAPLAGGWSAWQALVTQDGGRAVNTAGNIAHFTGLGWAGQAGTPLADADLRRREVGYLSGACLAVTRDAFDAVGGFDASYFLYHEDLDLSMRLRLAGGRLGLEPDARVEHDYEFAKGDYKWELMERNRWATLVRTWPGPVLAVALPALLATEVAIWVAAAAGGWLGAKHRATRDALREFPRRRRERAAIQAQRAITPAEFARWLVGDPSSPYLGAPSRVPPLRAALRLYWRAARALLGALTRAPAR
jgi:GT2 family glycosyltransferase